MLYLLTGLIRKLPSERQPFHIDSGFHQVERDAKPLPWGIDVFGDRLHKISQGLSQGARFHGIDYSFRASPSPLSFNCKECAVNLAVPFSCKTRICPTCMSRRAEDLSEGLGEAPSPCSLSPARSS